MWDELVDAQTVAKKFGMARTSVYRLAKSGRIPSYSTGPRLSGVRFDIGEVREALRRRASAIGQEQHG